MEEKQIIRIKQYGFRQQHSTEQQALRLAETIYNAFEKQMKQAFARVWHINLIHKLLRQNITTPMVKLMRNFITQKSRNNRLKIILKKIKAGVLQGAVLSPTLYNLYTADIPNSNRNVQIFTYPDDTSALSTSIKPNQSAKYLQNATDEITNWTKQNEILINPEKFPLIHFSRKINHPTEEIKIRKSNNST